MLPGPIGGVIKGSESGHKTAGLFLGTSGASGAEAKNTGKSTLYENMVSGGLSGATLGALSGQTDPRHLVSSAAQGATLSTLAYGAGHLFGKDYKKAKAKTAAKAKKKALANKK